MPAGRPGKPLLPDEREAFEDVADGAMSYEAAADFCSLSKSEIERAVADGEIETFPHKRRVLLVRRSVRLWLASKLVAERRRKVSA